MRHENIRKLLKEKRLKQIDLASLLGRDKSVITLLMQGKRKLGADEAVTLAHFFKVPVAVILDEVPIGHSDGRARLDRLAEPLAIPFQTPPRHVAIDGETVQEKGGEHYLLAEGVNEHDVALEVLDDAMNLAGLLKGDIVIAAMNETASPDDVVVVQHYEGDGAKSLLRRYQPPHLCADSTDSNARDFHIEEDDVRIIAPIKRMIRLY